VIKTVPEHEIVETLIEEAMRLADAMATDPEATRAPTGAPEVTVG
jgi:(E)-4-hydroxy-3-methylbut-2-enyl-diphosphate synthase